MPRLKTRFHYKQLPIRSGSVPVDLDFDGEFLAIYSTTGLFDFRMTSADDWVPGYAGLIFRTDREEKFTRLQFRSSAGTTIAVYYGVGDITLPANLGGQMQIYIGSVDDPNGVTTPADPANAAIYYKDQASPVVQWQWSVSGQNWFTTLS